MMLIPSFLSEPRAMPGSRIFPIGRMQRLALGSVAAALERSCRATRGSLANTASTNSTPPSLEQMWDKTG
jgi:hypothetical protein